MPRYLVSKVKCNKRSTFYEDISSSVLFWEKNKKESKADKIKVTYRSETVDGIKRVYYVCVDYSPNESWEYFLVASNKNRYIFEKRR